MVSKVLTWAVRQTMVLCPVRCKNRYLVISWMHGPGAGEVYIGSSELKVIGIEMVIKAMEVNAFNLGMFQVKWISGPRRDPTGLLHLRSSLNRIGQL